MWFMQATGVVICTVSMLSTLIRQNGITALFIAAIQVSRLRRLLLFRAANPTNMSLFSVRAAI